MLKFGVAFNSLESLVDNMSERAGLSDYILLSVEVVSSQGRSGSNFLVHLCYKPSGWLMGAGRSA